MLLWAGLRTVAAGAECGLAVAPAPAGEEEGRNPNPRQLKELGQTWCLLPVSVGLKFGVFFSSLGGFGAEVSEPKRLDPHPRPALAPAPGCHLRGDCAPLRSPGDRSWALPRRDQQRPRDCRRGAVCADPRPRASGEAGVWPATALLVGCSASTLRPEPSFCW